MRLTFKNELSASLSMMRSVHETLRIGGGTKAETFELLDQLYELAAMLDKFIGEEINAAEEYHEFLKSYCRSLYQVKLEMNRNRGCLALLEQTDMLLINIQERLETERPQ